MRGAAIMAVAVILTGCATAPRVIPQPVKVPVVQRCAPVLSPPIEYVDTDAALKTAPDLFTRVKLLLAGRLQRIALEAELTAAVDGCAK